MKTRVVVLGAGFGGLELTTMLSDALGDAIDIVLIDKGDDLPGFFGPVVIGEGRARALIACMRTLLTILTAMMRTNTTWQQVSQPENA